MAGHKKTPNAAPIINITMDDELLKLVEDYQFDNRIKNRSEAIRRLLKAGMEVMKQEKNENK